VKPFAARRDHRPSSTPSQRLKPTRKSHSSASGSMGRSAPERPNNGGSRNARTQETTISEHRGPMPCRLAGKPAKYFGPDHRPQRAHTSLRDLGLLRGGTQRLTADWNSASHHTDDDGERPRPVWQAGQIPAADVPLDLRAQLGGQCRYTLANWTGGRRKTGPVVFE